MDGCEHLPSLLLNKYFTPSQLPQHQVGLVPGSDHDFSLPISNSKDPYFHKRLVLLLSKFG